jgi:hypothetical protein
VFYADKDCVWRVDVFINVVCGREVHEAGVVRRGKVELALRQAVHEAQVIVVCVCVRNAWGRSDTGGRTRKKKERCRQREVAGRPACFSYNRVQLNNWT